MKKIIVLLSLVCITGFSFGQEETYPDWVEESIEKSRSEILRMYGLSKLETAFWLPSVNISQRFNAYIVESKTGGSSSTIPIAITMFDLQFFRFAWGFGGVRGYFQTPFSTDIKYGPLSDQFAGVGGYGGGYFFDTRKISEDGKKATGTAVSIAGEGYKMWSLDNNNISLSGGGLELRSIHNFHQFFGLSLAFNVSWGGIQYEGISESTRFTSIGGSIGVSF